MSEPDWPAEAEAIREYTAGGFTWDDVTTVQGVAWVLRDLMAAGRLHMVDAGKLDRIADRIAALLSPPRA